MPGGLIPGDLVNHLEAIVANKQQPETRTPDLSSTVLRNEKGLAVGVKFAFRNGKTFQLLATELSSEMQAECTAHGIKQKIGDAAAIPRDTKTGRSATIDEKADASYAVYSRLLEGSWNAEREGGGGTSLLYKAVCRVYSKKSPEALKTWLESKTDAEKAAMKKNPDIAKAMLAIQTEAVRTEGVDEKKLMAELDNIK